MLFNSVRFLAFLPIVFLLFWFVFRTRKWQNLLIVMASYFFYGCWDWRFLILIAFTSFCSFWSGLLITQYEGHRSVQRSFAALNIIINLLILGVFKYYNFFVENLEELFGMVGYRLDWLTLDVILPVGISFYTFQALSYTIDVYRGNIRPTHDIVEFFAFISFFPQLVAGPIERATNLLPQFQRQRQFEYTMAADGMRQMLWGFVKKMIIADNCATGVNMIWSQYSDETGLVLVVGAVLFTFQIYCDFSGYSDIAIGCARLFGINLMRNFNYPYFSRHISEFWQRWHISLMTWFRDYVYFPLGGSRCAQWKVVRNTLIVFFISGLWHGANWTFVVWGLYHACLITLFMLLGLKVKYKDVVAANRLFPSWKEFFQMLFTFVLAVIGWIIFRAENLHDSVSYLAGICSKSLFDLSTTMLQLQDIGGLNIALPAIALMLLAEWLQRDKQHALQFDANGVMARSIVLRYAVYIVLTLSLIGLSGSQSEFLYFQF